MRRNNPLDTRRCDDIRMRWLGWVGRRGIRPIEAIRLIGWSGKQAPHWMANGKIPMDWRDKLIGQIDDQKKAP